MGTSTIWIDQDVKEDATRIADELGLSFDMVVNILLRHFNDCRRFPFLPRLSPQGKTVFDMSSAEFEAACQNAVRERNAVPEMEYVTRIDKESRQIIQKYPEGRVEYVLY